MQPLKTCKISKANIVISPLPPTKKKCVALPHRRTASIEQTSMEQLLFKDACTVYARCCVQRHRAHWVITKVLILWSRQRRFLRVCIHNTGSICITKHYIRVQTYICTCTRCVHCLATGLILITSQFRIKRDILDFNVQNTYPY